MSAEHGVYVELLPKGKIKRDLAGVSGEVSLEGTTVSDEVILFSELSFGPYAVVVDLIRFQAKAILKHDDHGGLADMTEPCSTPWRIWYLLWRRNSLCMGPCSAYSWKMKYQRMTGLPCIPFWPAGRSLPF